MGENRLSNAERPKIGNDIYKHPLRTQMVAMDPESGLPRVVSAVTMADSAAPPLETESFVCMGDDSQFVIRGVWGDVLVSVDPSLVRPYPGEYGLRGWLAPLTAKQIDLTSAQAIIAARDLSGAQRLWYQVEPLRPQCKHYCRVMTDFEGSDEHKTVERVCTAQRTEGGEYISLGNTRIYACEHRNPRDFVSEQRLRKFDAESVARSKKSDEDWDGDAALEAARRTAGENNG